MRIGIDISQTAFANTGVANYLSQLIQAMVKSNDKDHFVLYFSSLRADPPFQLVQLTKLNARVSIKKYPYPPRVLDIIWNSLHIFPIEYFIGNIDIFITSDWTEPPVRYAKKMTIIYDCIVYTHPEETDKRIIKTQKRKLRWVEKESDAILCISNSTREDAKMYLHVPEAKLYTVYPGLI